MTTHGTLLRGKPLAHELNRSLAARVQRDAQNGPRPPCLCTVLVGDDPPSALYVRAKQRAAKQAGLFTQHHQLPADTAQKTLLCLIHRLNADDAVDGILVQLPLPDHINTQTVLRAVDPAKDVDGFHPLNVGLLHAGTPRFIPCTPRACLFLLHHARVPLAGARAVVVGRSAIVGQPMARLLLGEHATVTVCHSRTTDLAAVTAEADVIIAAAGRPHLLGREHVKPGATVIDVGTRRDAAGKLRGDVDTDAVLPVVHAITPVPGGVGPLTIAMLLENTYIARRGMPAK
ncbi:MAG: bifunctional 5,10-methylenetetrahydrofolate dehydrogenase/5,10-methenyltetrahydrofolate cyclohydrolase [Myxococcota bacterium]